MKPVNVARTKSMSRDLPATLAASDVVRITSVIGVVVNVLPVVEEVDVSVSARRKVIQINSHTIFPMQSTYHT